MQKFTSSAAEAQMLPLPNALLAQIIETQNDISQVEMDSATLTKIIVERTQKLTNADGAVLELIEESFRVYRAVSGCVASHLGLRIPLPGSLAADCIRSGQIEYCADFELSPTVDREACERTGVRSMILVPLNVGGRNAGILKVVSQRANAFAQQNVYALQLMAGLLGAALEHAAEFEVKKSLLEERTAALALLRESEKRFRSAFDHAAIGKALVALNGRFTQVNRSLCRMLGYTERELLSFNFQSITHPDDLNADLALVQRLVAGEIPNYQMSKRYIHKHGHMMAAQLSVSLVRDEAGNPSYFISQIQDMTDRLDLEAALRSSEEEHRAMFQLAGVGKAQTDLATGRFRKVNQKLCEMIGYTVEEAVGLSFDQITPREDIARSRGVADEMLRGNLADYTFEKRYIRKDGEIIWVSVNATVIREPSGRNRRAVATIVDITDRKRGEIFEADRSKALEMIVRDAPTAEVLGQLSQAVKRQISDSCAGFMLIEAGDVVVVAEEMADAWWGAVLGSAVPLSVKLTGQAWNSAGNVGVTFLRSDPVWEHLKAQAMERGVAACWSVPLEGADGAALGLFTVFCRGEREPGARERQTLDAIAKLAAVAIEHRNTGQQLAHWVRHDALTGLPNRIKFEDQLEQALGGGDENDSVAALLMIDIDHFKTINDTLGHHAGDHLLQQFAQRLKSNVQAGDTVARLGGDEFAVISIGLGGVDSAVEVARAILGAMEAPFDLPGDPAARVSASIGIALFANHSCDRVAVRELADTAMYRAKSNGRNQYHLSA